MTEPCLIAQRALEGADRRALQDLWVSLKTLRLRGPINPCHGICTALSELCDYRTSLLLALFEGWPHHSGDRSYPLPGGESSYTWGKPKWEGEQGKLRRDLVDYTLAKVEKMLRGEG